MGTQNIYFQLIVAIVRRFYDITMVVLAVDFPANGMTVWGKLGVIMHNLCWSDQNPERDKTEFTFILQLAKILNGASSRDAIIPGKALVLPHYGWHDWTKMPAPISRLV